MSDLEAVDVYSNIQYQYSLMQQNMCFNSPFLLPVLSQYAKVGILFMNLFFDSIVVVDYKVAELFGFDDCSIVESLAVPLSRFSTAIACLDEAGVYCRRQYCPGLQFKY